MRWQELMRGRWLAAVWVLGVLAVGLLAPGRARAETGLQLVPLKYQDTLHGGQVKSGYIDVSNPGDETVTIATSVEGFRQADLDGDLEFFVDDRLRAGIVPGLDVFELGPRESIRVTFSVDPARLPVGGVYAVIFFRTVPPTPAARTSYVAESANVGTLLMLQNGGAAAQVGQITAFDLPLWQFGNGIVGSLRYQNTNRDAGGAAFDPVLESRVLPWAASVRLVGPFVMPQSTRQFGLARPGSFVGLLPVTVTDTAAGRHVTHWVLACTGVYRWVVPAALVLAGWLAVWWRRRRRRRPARRALDGLSRRR